jgi:hypothetical protein
MNLPLKPINYLDLLINHVTIHARLITYPFRVDLDSLCRTQAAGLHSVPAHRTVLFTRNSSTVGQLDPAPCLLFVWFLATVAQQPVPHPRIPGDLSPLALHETLRSHL